MAPWAAVVASSGLILAAVYALMMVRRALHGPMQGAVADPALSFSDLTRGQLAMMLTLAVLLVGVGLHPQPLIDLAHAPVQAFTAIYSFGNGAHGPNGAIP